MSAGRASKSASALLAVVLLASSVVLGWYAWRQYEAGRPGSPAFPETNYENITGYSPDYLSSELTVRFTLQSDGNTYIDVLLQAWPDEGTCLADDVCRASHQPAIFTIAVELYGAAQLSGEHERMVEPYGGRYAEVQGVAYEPSEDNALAQLFIFEFSTQRFDEGRVAGAVEGVTERRFINAENDRRAAAMPNVYKNECASALGETSFQALQSSAVSLSLDLLSDDCDDNGHQEDERIEITLDESGDGRALRVDYTTEAFVLDSQGALNWKEDSRNPDAVGSFVITYTDLSSEALGERSTFVSGLLLGLASGLFTTALGILCTLGART